MERALIKISPAKNKVLFLCIILAFAALAFSQTAPDHATRSQGRAKESLSRCTNQALAAINSIPKLTYECTDDSDDEIQKSPERRAALRAYLPKLESAVGPGFWAASVDDLNACATRNNERAKTPEDQREIDSNPRVLGDRSTRLILLIDPCVKYSYITQNGFILQHASGRSYATRVLDAFYSRLDPGVELQLPRQNDATVIVIQTNSEPMMNTLFSTYRVYSINAATHHAVPKKLFMQSGKLTNEFEFDQYLFDDEETRKHWRPPELIHDGKLLPQFTVYKLKKNQDQIADTDSEFSRKTYVWKGRYYAPK